MQLLAASYTPALGDNSCCITCLCSSRHGTVQPSPVRCAAVTQYGAAGEPRCYLLLAGAGIRDARTRVRSNKGKNTEHEHGKWMDRSRDGVGPGCLASEQRPTPPPPASPRTRRHMCLFASRRWPRRRPSLGLLRCPGPGAAVPAGRTALTVEPDPRRPRAQATMDGLPRRSIAPSPWRLPLSLRCNRGGDQGRQWRRVGGNSSFSFFFSFCRCKGGPNGYP
jgi:hypothetical protein